MRTTITLTPEAEALVRKAMQDRRLSFKKVVNDAIVSGLSSHRGRVEFRTRTYDMGEPSVNLEKATQIAAELENQEFLRKMQLGQ